MIAGKIFLKPSSSKSEVNFKKIGTFTSVLALKSFKALHNIENSSLSWKLCKFSVFGELMLTVKNETSALNVSITLM